MKNYLVLFGVVVLSACGGPSPPTEAEALQALGGESIKLPFVASPAHQKVSDMKCEKSAERFLCSYEYTLVSTVAGRPQTQSLRDQGFFKKGANGWVVSKQ